MVEDTPTAAAVELPSLHSRRGCAHAGAALSLWDWILAELAADPGGEGAAGAEEEGADDPLSATSPVASAALALLMRCRTGIYAQVGGYLHTCPCWRLCITAIPSFFFLSL